MQNLIKQLEQFRSQNPHTSAQAQVNFTREYLQILILKSIYHSNFGKALCFMGGTCLRICYDLKRYSEDLNFTLDRPMKNYTFNQLLKEITRDLETSGFKVSSSVNAKAIVQKSFLKFNDVLQSLGLSVRKSEKLHIKLEIDTHPVQITDQQMESFFIHKFNEIFPILKHKKETLFAGKLLAILLRPYVKGRDYYDLIWYLSHRTPIDMVYLNNGISHANATATSLQKFETPQEVFHYLGERIHRINSQMVLKDIGRFLEDPKEEKWISEYPRVFEQLLKAF